MLVDDTAFLASRLSWMEGLGCVDKEMEYHHSVSLKEFEGLGGWRLRGSISVAFWCCGLFVLSVASKRSNYQIAQ